MNNNINLGKYDLKALISGADKINQGASIVLEEVKKMPRSEIETAIELGDRVTDVTAANQKLYETINRIIDEKNAEPVDDLPGTIFTKS